MKFRLFAAVLVVSTALALPLAAAVVHRSDETALQGKVGGLEKGNVIVSPTGADGAEKRVPVPLEEVVKIDFAPAAVAPAPATPAPAAPAQAVAQAPQGAPATAAPRSNRKGVSA